MKARMTVSLIWLQIHLPILVPVVDKIAHGFGICLGH